MVRRHFERSYQFLKSTAIGGIVFLLPMMVVGFLLGKIGSIVYEVAVFLNENLGIGSAHGYAVLLATSVAVLVILCFGAGVVAQWTIGTKLSDLIERYLTLIFPRYSIYKDQVAGGIGGDLARDRMKPVLVDVCGVVRPALEIERGSDGNVTIYFPGAPDPWSGTVGIVAPSKVKHVNADPGEFLATFERLGRDSAALIAAGTDSGKLASQSDSEDLDQDQPSNG